MTVMKRSVACVVALAFAMSAAACGEEETVVLSYDEAALTEPGPYAVGFQRTVVRAKDSPLVSAAEGVGDIADRSLPLLIWYPSTPGATGSPTILKIANLMKIPGVRSMDNLPVANGGPFPLAIYSHGSGGEGVLAYPFAEQLVSRGWIVVAPDHVGNTTLEMVGGGSKPMLEMSYLRLLDIALVLDAASASFGVEELASAVDDEKIFLFGHSFGGFTTMSHAGAAYNLDAVIDRACPAGDDEPDEVCNLFSGDAMGAWTERLGTLGAGAVRAIGLQAPATMGILDASGVNVPTLLLSGNRDQTTTDPTSAEPIWAGLHNSEDVWVRFADAGHYSFISMCDDFSPELVENFARGSLEDGCGEDFLPVGDAIRINTAFLVAFAEKHVLGVTAWDAFLAGETPLEVVETSGADLTLVKH